MNSIDFLTNNLEILQNKFSNCNIRYEFISNTNMHLIEVTPLHLYNDDMYINEELILEEEFENLFPDEEIIFISEDSLNKIKDPILELYHKKEGTLSAEFNVVDDCINFVEYISEEYINKSMIENNYALAA